MDARKPPRFGGFSQRERLYPFLARLDQIKIEPWNFEELEQGLGGRGSRSTN